MSAEHAMPRRAAFGRLAHRQGLAASSYARCALLSVVAASCSLIPISARGGAWTLPGGQLRLEQSVGYWRTDRKFASSLDTSLTFSDRGRVCVGDRIPFDPSTGGDLEVLSLTTAARLGVLDWLELGVTLPLLWNDFDTGAVDTVKGRFGIGDLLLLAQAGLPVGPLALAGRLELKVPTGDFDPVIYAAPLTEGQFDLTTLTSVGVSLHPHGYANAEVGWRIRFENPANRHDPGDELLFALEAGAHLPYRLMIKLVVDGLVGMEGSTSQLVTQALPRRRLCTFWTGLLWRPLQQLSLEMDARFLLAGEDFPTGIQLFFKVSTTVQLWE